MRADFDQRARQRAQGSKQSPAEPSLGPTLEHYVAYAAERNPELRASFERWRAGVHRVSPARRLPDPMLEFGAYVWDSSGGFGFTPARVGIRQEFPWPTQLGAAADQASAEARAQQRRFEAQLLEIRQQVSEAYFQLWLLRQVRTIEQEQLEILQGLSESALGQLAIGATSLADQQQIDLTAARLRDAITAIDEQERAAQAKLRAAIGAPPDTATPTPEHAPDFLARPAETEQTLRAALQDHPFVDSFTWMQEAAESMARSQRAERLPGFAVGVEWMRMPGAMGESAIMPSVGIRLPIWQESYDEGIRAAEAEAAALQAERESATQMAQAELEEALAMIRDSLRRVSLNESTLLPQAQAAYESVLGAYATGRSDVAASLLAQRDLLEIRLDLERARVEHAVAWTRLERIVGRRVERTVVLEAGK